MYKVLLCWRYLRTRYLAMVCIVSVMLGVATLIVVNSVMSGFSTKLRERLHGLFSDVIIEGNDISGFADPDGKIELIRSDPFLAERIEAMTPTLEIFGMLQFTYRDMPIIRPVKVVGIQPEGRALLGGFSEFLVDKRGKPSFELNEQARARYEGRESIRQRLSAEPIEPEVGPDGKPLPAPPPSPKFVPPGAILGYAICHFRNPDAPADSPDKEVRTLDIGDEVAVATISGVQAGAQVRPVASKFIVSNYFRSEMSEYDSNYVFVPLEYLQRLRTMEGRATNILIKLKDPRQAEAVVKRLKDREVLGWAPLRVLTWQDKQGPLLAAIDIERGILNLLLFMIVGVAGFGILAIFSMIVVEKTRDIGILKALGASNKGVMSIFLSYGLLLGLVGAVLGTALGITITVYINEIEFALSTLCGLEIFNRNVYYFKEIPTHIQPFTVFMVNLGAVGIAVVFSILPALRAAMLHPVRALRFE